MRLFHYRQASGNHKTLRGLIMWQDPIVEEVRLEREKYAALLNFDVDTIVADLQEQQARSNRIVLELT